MLQAYHSVLELSIIQHTKQPSAVSELILPRTATATEMANAGGGDTSFVVAVPRSSVTILFDLNIIAVDMSCVSSNPSSHRPSIGHGYGIRHCNNVTMSTSNSKKYFRRAHIYCIDVVRFSAVFSFAGRLLHTQK